MTAQFDRRISLIVGPDAGTAIDLSDLRIVFYINRSDTPSPNSLHAIVYNVSDETAHKISNKEFTRVVLQAGYADAYGIVFDGSIVQVRRGRDSTTGTDTYLDITAADGDEAYNFAIVNTTLAAGSKPEDHVKVCTAAMSPNGVVEGYRPALGGNPLPRGKVMFGMARDLLETVTRTTRTLWSIQDGHLQIVPETSYRPGEVPVINASTGMVGVPEQTSDGITVRMLLNPSIRIGGLVKLDNASIQSSQQNFVADPKPDKGKDRKSSPMNKDGFYQVMQAKIWGDTRGAAWYTEIVCMLGDATPGLGLSDGAGGISASSPAKPDVVPAA